MSPKCYMVVSDEYTTHAGGAYEPAEFGRAVLFVRTTTQSRAKALAVRAWRREDASRGRLEFLYDGNPFRGMKVERVDERQYHTEVDDMEAPRG